MDGWIRNEDEGREVGQKGEKRNGRKRFTTTSKKSRIHQSEELKFHFSNIRFSKNLNAAFDLVVYPSSPFVQSFPSIIQPATHYPYSTCLLSMLANNKTSHLLTSSLPPDAVN